MTRSLSMRWFAVQPGAARLLASSCYSAAGHGDTGEHMWLIISSLIALQRHSDETVREIAFWVFTAVVLVVPWPSSGYSKVRTITRSK